MIDSLCLDLQHLIRNTPMPEDVARPITGRCPQLLADGRRLVVRSSSNAEDLPGFSAAGRLRLGHDRARCAANSWTPCGQVWASLLSPRSVRLRHQVGHLRWTTPTWA